jgi:hypothetical protein
MASSVTHVLSQECYRCPDRARHPPFAIGYWSLAIVQRRPSSPHVRTETSGIAPWAWFEPQPGDQADVELGMVSEWASWVLPS